jgi:acyl dehydratase
MSSLRKKAVEGFHAGDTISISRTFSQDDVIRFAEVTKDYNPVHFDDRFASVKKFKSRICHGLLAASLLTEIGGQIGWLASGMQFQYKKPVYFQDTITCEFTISQIDDRGRAKADVIYKNQDGVTVIEAYLTGILPGHDEKKVLQEMLDEGDPTNQAGDRNG